MDLAGRPAVGRGFTIRAGPAASLLQSVHVVAQTQLDLQYAVYTVLVSI
jgi:hypothetical protein